MLRGAPLGRRSLQAAAAAAYAPPNAGLHAASALTQAATPAATAAPPAAAAAAGAAAAQPSPLRFDDARTAFKSKSTLELLRTIFVFRACGIKPLVAHADAALALSKRLLGETVTNAIVRATFYKQFVAGEDAQRIQPTLARLRSSGVRAILDYAAEDDVSQDEGPKSRQEPSKTVVARTYEYSGERACDGRMSVFLKSIEAAHSAEGQGFAAIKMTALGLPALLERASTSLLSIRDLFSRFDTDGDGFITQEHFAQVYGELFVDEAPERIEEMFKALDTAGCGRVDYVAWISKISVMDTHAIASRCRSRGPFAEAALSDEELVLMRNMMARVDRLAQAAAQADVRLLVDAEHSYFQPAIDATVTDLQRRYNTAAPRVYNTVQCYLKDSRPRLLTELERARREGYHYGVKLVRGAYMVLERQRAAEQGYASPIHDTIADTHANYDACVAEMLRCVRDEGGEVMVASHNQRSIEGAVAGMAALGLPPGAGVYFGQLLGMADNLTFTLGAHGYGAYKYVPFGEIGEVLPYLIRRAQENSDMLAGVGGELRMLSSELQRRLLTAPAGGGN